MPRRSVKTAVDGIEVRRRTVKKKVNVNEMTPNEIQHKQSIAVFLRAATYTNTQIAEALGVTKGTVKAWFKEKPVIALYEETLESLSTAAKQFLETLTIEAVKRLAQLMYDDDSKIALDAVREILDRGGLPKLSRVEKKDTSPPSTEPQRHVHEIRLTDPATAERYAELVNEAESITAAAAKDKS